MVIIGGITGRNLRGIVTVYGKKWWGMGRGEMCREGVAPICRGSLITVGDSWDEMMDVGEVMAAFTV